MFCHIIYRPWRCVQEMSNELQIIETEELTEAEKTELGRNIDRLIYTHKNNRQEINRLVFASVAAMTDADRDQADLSRKADLKILNKRPAASKSFGGLISN